MTLEEIFNGKKSYFPGLLPLIYAYLDYIDCDAETFAHVDKYLTFISRYGLCITKYSMFAVNSKPAW